MKQKPGHLGLKYTEQFKYISLVDVYHYHRPYPDDAMSNLVTSSIITGRSQKEGEI